MRRSTVFGQMQVHSVELAENSIFMGKLYAVRRGIGCVRFCYVTPGSRTPRRFRCQPDLVGAAEQDRVRPEFTSVRYGTPGYCQLALSCAIEIRQGADDGSEMGVFHDLFQPQREAMLRARLNEFTPAGMESGIIFAN
jgi:hypothetical protein